MQCSHVPPCPRAADTDHEAARVVATHPEQGWSLLCNGVVTFDDCGELLPDGRAVAAPAGPVLALAHHSGVPAGIRRTAIGGRTH
ncbi:DUF5999 family protein [Pseudosporangium ferrugineum]|uniref:Uncharacterized protein n=1 Tax=Pseudosporangium ferrugineum TaxID=439699 RepID=A0A2T0RQ56_9ACTN|nr:DUF5999 family protein [Pseudosporangium ferrugineum]PRY23308.1 hypothetical protein CLV70_11535 [Pseudosporangium ferrugineum]